ncbi:MAG TPA: hypothetical protein PLB67_14510 [Candidatus Hydrogenedentes bacterium]|jgi:hypothetical protein|nr:hypothetical protein [Candidatus Hydrogenedentota bacterium]MDY0032102.1 hypothetical protein [FCB group bacterium]NLT61532.1 hypothetical protein [Candidatus Hydrogenedentota bacterium]HNV21411.1 hypothetical protein [Candidatus Hydrogenedentota bacterium]HNZ18979.1 hypothetical protein [Candidatus Hydrogenedentota bacterium]
MFENKNFFFILLGVVACALVLVIAVDLTSDESMIKQATSGRAYTKELRQFRNLIQLGTPADQVQAIFKQQNFQHLQLTGGKGGVYEVSPPITYGKNNWTLVIGTSNDVVVSVLVRKYADRTTKPAGAPDDIAYPGYGGAS